MERIGLKHNTWWSLIKLWNIFVHPRIFLPEESRGELEASRGKRFANRTATFNWIHQSSNHVPSPRATRQAAMTGEEGYSRPASAWAWSGTSIRDPSQANGAARWEPRGVEMPWAKAVWRFPQAQGVSGTSFVLFVICWDEGCQRKQMNVSSKKQYSPQRTCEPKGLLS